MFKSMVPIREPHFSRTFYDNAHRASHRSARRIDLNAQFSSRRQADTLHASLKKNGTRSTCMDIASTQAVDFLIKASRLPDEALFPALCVAVHNSVSLTFQLARHKRETKLGSPQGLYSTLASSPLVDWSKVKNGRRRDFIWHGIFTCGTTIQCVPLLAHMSERDPYNPPGFCYGQKW